MDPVTLALAKRYADSVADGARASDVALAAVDSPAHLQAAADYVCDGVDDEVQFKAALKDSLLVTDAWDRQSESPVMPYGDFPCIWFDGTTYHAYYGYASGVGHATSADAITWTNDVANNPVIPLGVSLDNTAAEVPVVWTETVGETTTWYMLYRGNGSNIMLATGTDAVTWTKSGSNPVINQTTYTNAKDPPGIIKVGSTYHLFTNNTGGNRQVDRFTSTDLTTWTPTLPSPLFDGVRYCSAPFKRGSFYYLMVSKALHSGAGGAIELWRDTGPEFLPGRRVLLGAAIYDDPSVSIDTPSIVTDTIGRDTFPDDKLLVLWAKAENTAEGASYPGFLINEADIDAAIAKVATPRAGKVILYPGTYTLTPTAALSAAPDLVYGQQMEGIGSVTIRVKDGHNTASGGLILVDEGCSLRNVTIDGRKAQNTNAQDGPVVASRGVLEDVRVRDMRGYGVRVWGTARRVVVSGALGEGGFDALDGALLEDADAVGNIIGVYVRGKNVRLRNVNSGKNSGRGVYVLVSGLDWRGGTVYENGVTSSAQGAVDIGVNATLARVQNVRIRDHTTWGLYVVAPGASFDGVLLERNFTASASAANCQVGFIAAGRFINGVTTESPTVGGSIRVTTAAAGTVIGACSLDKAGSNTAAANLFANVIAGTYTA